MGVADSPRTHHEQATHSTQDQPARKAEGRDEGPAGRGRDADTAAPEARRRRVQEVDRNRGGHAEAHDDHQGPQTAAATALEEVT